MKNEDTKTTSRSIGLLDIILICAVLIMSLVSNRFLAQIMAFTLIALLVCRITSRTRWPTRCFYVVFFVWLGGLVLPVDLAIRSADAFSVKFVKVIRMHGRKASLNEAEAKGLQLNVDFVVYDRISDIPGPVRAILITLPIRYKIRTPLF